MAIIRIIGLFQDNNEGAKAVAGFSDVWMFENRFVIFAYGLTKAINAIFTS